MNDKRFLIEFIYNSNKIEGSEIPKEEVEKIIKKQTYYHINTNEVREVLNSIDTLKYLLRQPKLTKELIVECYNRFTECLYMDNDILYPKGFRSVDIYIGGNKGADPKEIPKLIDELVSFFDRPLLEWQIYQFHLKYETIHPFIDGNGRTGRLLMNFLLIKHGYNPIIIFDSNKQAYYTALQKGRNGRMGYDTFFNKQRKKTDKLLK